MDGVTQALAVPYDLMTRLRVRAGILDRQFCRRIRPVLYRKQEKNVQKRRRRAFRAHIRYRNWRQSCTEVGGTGAGPADHGAVRWAGPQKIHRSFDFGIHIWPVADAVTLAKGVRALSKQEGTCPRSPWPFVPITRGGK